VSAERWLMIAALAAALLYSALLIRRPVSPVRTVIKTCAVGAIAVLAFVIGAPIALIAALGFCAVGDAFLAGDPKRWLPLGLGAFLIGHLIYIWLFLHNAGGMAALAAEPWRIIAVAAVGAAGVTMLTWLWGSLGRMRIAVAVYTIALTVMAGVALTLPRWLWPAMPGAVDFMASDALLAAQLFKGRGSAWSSQAVWWLYFAAQALIAWAYLR
jgi:uncharacterized membrane protein YhhN